MKSWDLKSDISVEIGGMARSEHRGVDNRRCRWDGRFAALLDVAALKKEHGTGEPESIAEEFGRKGYNIRFEMGHRNGESIAPVIKSGEGGRGKGETAEQEEQETI